jgi:hypothetical protein
MDDIKVNRRFYLAIREEALVSDLYPCREFYYFSDWNISIL